MVGKRVRRISVWSEPMRAAVMAVEWKRADGTWGRSVRSPVPPEVVDKVAHLAYGSARGYIRPMLTGPTGFVWEIGPPEVAQCPARE